VDDRWNHDKGIASMEDLVEVFILIICKATYLADKRLTATILEKNVIYLRDDSFQGKIHQLTIFGEMVPRSKLMPHFTSQAIPSWSFLELNLVCLPTIPELHTISCDVIELLPLVAWDNLCIKSTH
jgi:hypothetical protein